MTMANRVPPKDAPNTARDVLGAGWIDANQPILHYRLSLWTQYRRWLWNGLRSGSFAVVAMGCFVLGMYAAVIMGMLK